MYKCGKCGLEVVVTKEATIRACKCKAPIIASMEATAFGKGGMNIKHGNKQPQTTS